METPFIAAPRNFASRLKEEILESEETYIQSSSDKAMQRPKSTEHICPDCNEVMHNRTNLAYLCDSCGRYEDVAAFGTAELGAESGGSEVMENYSTSESSAAPLRVAGPGNHAYQRNLVSSTTNYKKTQKRQTIERFEKYIFEYEGPRPPQDVVKQACELYYQVQQCTIIRADVLRGTMAACLYIKCREHNLTRKPKEIAEIFGVAQEKLSAGREILDDLAAQGLLNDTGVKQVFNLDSEIDSFLTRYFETLGIPEETTEIKYKEFAQRLIKFSQKYYIAGSSIISSKCAGAVHILAQCCPSLKINREQIATSCLAHCES